MAKILIVDDEARIRQILKIMLISLSHTVDEAEDGMAALEKLEEKSFDLVISDIRMDRLDGHGLLQKIREADIPCPVVFITAFASTESVVEALRLGAVDYLVKPFDEAQVTVTVERALGMAKLLSENKQLKLAIKNGRDEQFVFASKDMAEVEEMAVKVAQSDATVLITGESGTGKEVIARLIHRASSRAGQRFVAVNCAAITETLVEAELFGHEKGHLPGQTAEKRESSSMPMGELFFWMKWGSFP